MNAFGFNTKNTFGFNTRNNYVVKKGDSLYKIASKYDVSIASIMSLNNLADTIIYPDQIIVIPNKNGSMYFEEYVILENESISSIAKKLNIPLEVIIKYNDVVKLVIKEGQTLNIPIRNEVYIVSNSDTYATIMSKFNLTFEELVSLNAHKWFKPKEEIHVK